jgi:hypothetical protein
MTTRELAAALGRSHQTVAKDVRAGMPTDSPEAAQSWRRANRRARIDTATTRRPAGGKPDKPSGVVHTKLPTYDPAGGVAELERLQAIVIRCMEAAEQSASTAELAAANRALKEARDTVRIAKRDMAETEIEAGNLIRRDDVLAVFNEFLGKARALVESMPQELAAQCNPSDPQLSANVMTDWSNNKYMVTMSQPPDVLAVDQV